MKNDNQTILTDAKQEQVITYANGRKVKRKLKDHEIDIVERGIYNSKNQSRNRQNQMPKDLYISLM